MKKETVAMLLAGGQGSRLYVLTSSVAKPAVPFGGKYRIIDFPLSNCANSGIDTVGVLTQYRPLELNSYIGSGQPWDLDRSEGGVHILPPYVETGDEGTWYKGTANAIYQNIGFIDQYDPDCVLVLSGDHIYKMDYSEMIERHRKAGADCTISVMERPMEEAPRFGIMSVDGEDNITDFEEKPKSPRATSPPWASTCSRGGSCRRYLIEDENDENSQNDFGKNIIPKMLADGRSWRPTASPATGRTWARWTPCGTPTWTCSPRSPAWTCWTSPGPSTPGASTSPPPTWGLPPGSPTARSTAAAIIDGTVQNSVLSPGAVIEEGAEVELLRAAARRQGGIRRRGALRHPGGGLPRGPRLPRGRRAGGYAPRAVGADGPGARLRAGGGPGRACGDDAQPEQGEAVSK
jgi:glucose-1-phosphate adenylyltransferase